MDNRNSYSRRNYPGGQHSAGRSDRASAGRSTFSAQDNLFDDFDRDDFDDFLDDYLTAHDGGSTRQAPRTQAHAFESSFDDDFDDELQDDFGDAAPSVRPERVTENRHADRSRRPEHQGARTGFNSPSAEPASGSRMSTALSLVILAMALIAACLVPSGHLIEETGVKKEQHSATFDILTGIDSLKVNATNVITGQPKVYTLPMSNTPGNKPNPEKYGSYIDDNGNTHDTYVDDTISLDLCRAPYQRGKYSVMITTARVKIAHPTQLRSGFAGGEFGSRRVYLTKIAEQYNALIAINGEMYNHTGRRSILVRNGTVYRDTAKVNRSLFIDSQGDFHILSASEAVKNGILENEENMIYHTFDFGPPLVIDGEAQSYPKDKSLVTYCNPRTAIGQLGKLEYLVVVVDGRTETSDGLPINELAKFMQEQGCIQAYNFDGGQSSELVFKGKPYNEICNGGERGNADILYFSTAMPEE